MDHVFIIRLERKIYDEIFLPFLKKINLTLAANLEGEMAEIEITNKSDLKLLQGKALTEIDNFEEILSAIHEREVK